MAVTLFSGAKGPVDWHDGIAVTWLGRLTTNTILGAATARPLILIAVWASGPGQRTISASFGGRSGQLMLETWMTGHGLLLFAVADPPLGQREVIVEADNPADTGLIFGVFALQGTHPAPTGGIPATAQGSAGSQTPVGLPAATASDVVIFMAGSAGAITVPDARLVRLDDGAHDRDGNRVILGLVNGTDAAIGAVSVNAGPQPMVAAAVTITGW
jgi:hypothetical protein